MSSFALLRGTLVLSSNEKMEIYSGIRTNELLIERHLLHRWATIAAPTSLNLTIMDRMLKVFLTHCIKKLPSLSKVSKILSDRQWKKFWWKVSSVNNFLRGKNKEKNLGSGCSKMVKHTSHDQHVKGLNPARCWASLIALLFLSFLSRVSWMESLKEVHF